MAGRRAGKHWFPPPHGHKRTPGAAGKRYCRRRFGGRAGPGLRGRDGDGLWASLRYACRVPEAPLAVSSLCRANRPGCSSRCATGRPGPPPLSITKSGKAVVTPASTQLTPDYDLALLPCSRSGDRLGSDHQGPVP